tara:strand:+ start:163 stop:264 length:102 start_codon:yes stop_codon:yes gene_type:complete
MSPVDIVIFLHVPASLVVRALGLNRNYSNQLAS